MFFAYLHRASMPKMPGAVNQGTLRELLHRISMLSTPERSLHRQLMQKAHLHRDPMQKDCHSYANGLPGGPHILTPLASVCIGLATFLHRVPMQKGGYPYANGMPGVSLLPLVFDPLNPLTPLTILLPFTPSSSLAHFHRIRDQIGWIFGPVLEASGPQNLEFRARYPSKS